MKCAWAHKLLVKLANPSLGLEAGQVATCQHPLQNLGSPARHADCEQAKAFEQRQPGC